MKIKLTIDFYPNVSYRAVQCYFDSKQEMDNFLGILDKISKKRYTYKWEEVKTESED